MKRFFSTMMLLASLFATVSCDDNDNDNAPTDDYVGTKYTGSTYVTATYGGNEGTYESEDTVAYLNVKESSVDLTIAKACFTKDIPFVSSEHQMPSLDIVLPNIANVSGTRYAASSVTPTMLDGEPYGNDIIKSIDNVVVYIDGDYIDVSFDCTVYINLTGSGSQDFTFTIKFNNYEAPLVTTPTIPTTTTDEDYPGSVFIYKDADNNGEPDADLHIKFEDVSFSLIESNGTATLVARDFKFTDKQYAPLLTMVIEGIPTCSSEAYKYEAEYIETYAFTYDSNSEEYSYYETTEISHITITLDEDLGVMFNITYGGTYYEISFYNQDE